MTTLDKIFATIAFGCVGYGIVVSAKAHDYGWVVGFAITGVVLAAVTVRAGRRPR